MSREVADRVRGENVVVVGNAFELAPWAAGLVANDKVWWTEHPAARKFAGRKFTTKTLSGIERHRGKGVGGDSNSGMLGIDVAVEVFKASQVLLLGFDFQGTHFFGRYTNGCSNTTVASRVKHHRQMKVWRMLHPKVDVVNLTPGSALRVFPMAELDAYVPPQRLVA
jgi:hypothetical protein